MVTYEIPMIALNVREYLVLEYRLDFGPGYRVYFGRDGDMLVILLAGGFEGRHRGHAGRRREHRQDDPARLYQGGGWLRATRRRDRRIAPRA